MIPTLTTRQLTNLIFSYADISLEKERYEKIISDFFSNYLEISFSKINSSRILWLHARNIATTGVVNHFKNETGNVDVTEIFSIDELSSFTEKTESHEFKMIVTEMGFWKDKTMQIFDKIAGLTGMKILNNWPPDLKHKFVISERVGRNDELLKDRCKALGFIHTATFTPMQRSLPMLTVREIELHQCITQLRKSLFSKPISSPGEEQSYPIKHFNIDYVFDIENPINKYHFYKKQDEFLRSGKSNQWDWQFHGSGSKEATYNIAVNNFSLTRLGEYTGNRGCYGEGIYLSPRGYLPMYISILEGHFMILACKVIKGTSQVVKCFAEKDYTKGVPIPDRFDSNVSDNLNEVVIRHPSQILPSFIIKFSLNGLKKLGDIIWKTPRGDKQYPDIYCNEERLWSFV